MDERGSALVTGASRGIGRAIALELVRRGFAVHAGMRRPADGAALVDEAAGLPGRLMLARLDVNDPDSIEIPDDLAVLVNNAGIEGPYLPVEAAPLSLWRELFETNVFGLVEVTRRALPVLRRRGRGVICNVTSCSLLTPMPLFAAYRASKAAVSALSESLRVELAAHGVRVVEVQPGAIETDMLAASRRMPEAIGCSGYEALARRLHAAREQLEDRKTPAAEAARRIADVIEKDGGRLRYACDPMSDGLLAAWRAGDDETLASGMLALFGSS